MPKTTCSHCQHRAWYSPEATRCRHCGRPLCKGTKKPDDPTPAPQPDKGTLSLSLYAPLTPEE